VVSVVVSLVVPLHLHFWVSYPWKYLMVGTEVVIHALVMVVMADVVRAAVVSAMVLEVLLRAESFVFLKKVHQKKVHQRKLRARSISLAVVHQSQNNLRSAGVNSQTVFSELSQSHYLSSYDERWMGSTRRFLQKLEIRKAYRKLVITTQVGG